MKKIALIFSMVILAGAVFAQQSFYDFKVKDIEGNDFDLSTLKGKKVLVVNTASKCGLTPQYKELQQLYERYGGKNLQSSVSRPTILPNRNRGQMRKYRSSAQKIMALLFR